MVNLISYPSGSPSEVRNRKPCACRVQFVPVRYIITACVCVLSPSLPHFVPSCTKRQSSSQHTSSEKSPSSRLVYRTERISGSSSSVNTRVELLAQMCFSFLALSLCLLKLARRPKLVHTPNVLWKLFQIKQQFDVLSL